MVAIESTRNALVDAWAALGDYVALFSGDPGTTGANEITTGGTTRQQTVYPPAANSTTTGTELTYDVDPETVTHVGFFATATGGLPFDVVDSQDVVFNVAGQCKVIPSFTMA